MARSGGRFGAVRRAKQLDLILRIVGSRLRAEVNNLHLATEAVDGVG
jgi:hypothetical protein